MTQQQELFRTGWDATLPDWLVDNLDQLNRPPAGDKAVLGECSWCHQAVLQIHHHCNWKLHPHTLTAAEEAELILAGRPTFTITTDTFGFHETNRRHHWTMALYPAGKDQPRKFVHVLPEHRCNTTHPGTPINWDTLYKKPATAVNDDQPPF